MKKAILLILAIFLITFAYAQDNTTTEEITKVSVLLSGREGETKEIEINEQTYTVEFIVVGEKRVQININQEPLVLDLPSSKAIKLDNQDVTVYLTNVLDTQANLKFETKEPTEEFDLTLPVDEETEEEVEEEVTEEETTPITLPTTEQTVPGVTTVTGNAVKKVIDSVKTNPVKYIVGLVIIIIVIYFIFISLEKDPEQKVDKHYRKAEDLHKTAEEYHEDGFPNLAEKTHQKAEKYRQKAREAKLNI